MRISYEHGSFRIARQGAVSHGAHDWVDNKQWLALPAFGQIRDLLQVNGVIQLGRLDVLQLRRLDLGKRRGADTLRPSVVP